MRTVVILMSLALAQPCLARTGDTAVPSRPGSEPGGWSITLGAAPVVSTAWQGSKDVVLSVFPDLRVAYGDTLFASVPEGLGWNALNRDGWKAGPIAKVRFGRDEDGRGSPFVVAGRSDALAGLGDIDAAAEVGAFAEKRFGSQQQWGGRLEVRRGFGGHTGIVGDASLTYRLRSGRAIVNVGPRLTAASGSFVQTYFGIDAGQSLGSGLATYRPKGGLLSYGLSASLVRPLDRRSALTLFTSLDRLGGIAAASPLVRERGQPTQFSLGVGYGYRFGL